MEKETGIARRGKTPIRTIHPIENVSIFSAFVDVVDQIKIETRTSGLISNIPFKILLHKRIVSKIIRDHGVLPSENLVLAANNPTSIRSFVDKAGKEKLNIIKEFSDGAFVIGAEKKRHHYFTVTFFEIKDKTYLASIKKRGRLVFSSEGAAVPSSATPS